MSLNMRQLRLKNMIELGNIPEVVDATIIYNEDESKIPFHWYDIECLNYGHTTKQYDYDKNEMLISRYYTGPNSIKLMPWNKLLHTGDSVHD